MPHEPERNFFIIIQSSPSKSSHRRLETEPEQSIGDQSIFGDREHVRAAVEERDVHHCALRHEVVEQRLVSSLRVVDARLELHQ